MSSVTRRPWTLISLALLFTLAPACSDDTTPPPARDALADGHSHQHVDGTSIDLEGCEHMKEGPFVDVTAGADAASAASVAADHKAYRVKLTSGQAGFVRFAAGSKGDLLVFADADAPLAVTDDQGKAVAVSTAGVTVCSEVKTKHTTGLAAVGSYVLRLGPGPTLVTLVLELESH